MIDDDAITINMSLYHIISLYCIILYCIVCITLLFHTDTIGDAFVVVGGLPGYKSVHNHALACVQFALHMLTDIEQIRKVSNYFTYYITNIVIF